MLNLSLNILLVNSLKEFYFKVFGRKKIKIKMEKKLTYKNGGNINNKN